MDLLLLVVTSPLTNLETSSSVKDSPTLSRYPPKIVQLLALPFSDCHSRGGDAGGPSTAFPGQSSAPNMGNNHLENDDRPLMKERMDRNIQEMERWAMASAQRYPKHR